MKKFVVCFIQKIWCFSTLSGDPTANDIIHEKLKNLGDIFKFFVGSVVWDLSNDVFRLAT